MKTLSFLTLFVSLFFVGCASETTPFVEKIEPQAFVLHRENFQPELSLTGSVQSEKEVPLSSKISGHVEALLVDVGDSVLEGQVLLKYVLGDNASQVDFQNSLLQLDTTKMVAEDAVRSAHVNLQTMESQHNQNIKQTDVSIQKIFETLLTKINNTKTLSQQILRFLDQTMGASSQFRYQEDGTTVEMLGYGNTVDKQKLLNWIENLARKYPEKNVDRWNISEQEILLEARSQIDFLKDLKASTELFYQLAVHTPTVSDFSAEKRDKIASQAADYLRSIDADIFALQTQMESSIVEKETLQAGLLKTYNAIKDAEAQLQLSQASSENQVSSAQTRVNLAQTFQKELILRAPFPGVITQKFVEVGELVSPGNTVLELADMSILKVNTSIPDTFIGKIKKGMKADILLDGISGTYQGEISKIYPSVDSQTRNLGIEITFLDPSDDIKLHMFARVLLRFDSEQIFFVPREYISYAADKSFVFLKDGTKVSVKTGTEKDGFVEIFSEELQEGSALLFPSSL